MSELDKAVEDLKKEHARAQKLAWVSNPLTYSIYWLWKKYSRKHKEQNNECRRAD